MLGPVGPVMVPWTSIYSYVVQLANQHPGRDPSAHLPHLGPTSKSVQVSASMASGFLAPHIRRRKLQYFMVTYFAKLGHPRHDDKVSVQVLVQSLGC